MGTILNRSYTVNIETKPNILLITGTIVQTDKQYKLAVGRLHSDLKIIKEVINNCKSKNKFSQDSITLTSIYDKIKKTVEVDGKTKETFENKFKHFKASLNYYVELAINDFTNEDFSNILFKNTELNSKENKLVYDVSIDKDLNENIMNQLYINCILAANEDVSKLVKETNLWKKYNFNIISDSKFQSEPSYKSAQKRMVNYDMMEFSSYSDESFIEQIIPELLESLLEKDINRELTLYFEFELFD